MASPATRRWTVADYLAFENDSEIRHEFFDGEVFAMSGASRWHNFVAANISASLVSQLKKTDCGTMNADARIRVQSTGLHTYPDVVVFCGDVVSAPDDDNTFLNPTLIVEVLSPSTERYDRTRKLDNYRQIESLQHVLLVAQDTVRVESYRRAGSDWVYSAYSLIEESVDVPSLPASLPLADIYDRIEFPPSADPDGTNENGVLA